MGTPRANTAPRVSRAGRLFAWSIGLISLVLSVGYNALWVLSAPGIVEMTCLADYAGVESSMLSSRAKGDWTRVSALLPYLYEYNPRDQGGCIDRQPVSNPWVLPLQALIVHAELGRTAHAGLEPARRRELGRICRETAERLQPANVPSLESPCTFSAGGSSTSASQLDRVSTRSQKSSQAPPP